MDVQQDLSSCSRPDEAVETGKLDKSPIYLFERFVSTVPSDLLKDTQSQSKLSVFVRDLCMKAPFVAQYLLQEILNHLTDDSQPKAQGPKEREPETNYKSSKRTKQMDGTYRLPKPSRIQSYIPIPKDEAEGSDAALEGRSIADDDSATCQPRGDMTINQSDNSHTVEKPQNPRECEGETLEIFIEEVLQEEAHSRTVDSEPALHPLEATYGGDSALRDAAHRPPSVALALNGSIEDSQTICLPLSPSELELQHTALPEIDGKALDSQASSALFLLHGTNPNKTTLSGVTPSTPVGQISRGFQSPLSDDQTVTPNTVLFTPTVNREVLSPLTEVDRTTSPLGKVDMTLLGEIPSSLSSIGQQQTRLSNTAPTLTQRVHGQQQLPSQNCQSILPSPLLGEAPILTNMVAEAVYLMHEMSKRQEIPSKVHSSILSTLRPSLSGTLATAAVAEQEDSIWIKCSSTSWSASMWINVLEAGQARSREAIILNMIEWMGASEWYDAELAQAEKSPPLTKRGKLRKRVATVVLDEYLKEAQDITAIGIPGKPAPGDSDRPSSPNSSPIQKRIFNAKRRKLNKIFHRGRILRKLVQMTHLGILFDSNIWRYAKASKEDIDRIAALFQADPQMMDLLSILDEQVELLVKTGRPDLSRFFGLLKSHSIIASEEVSSLRANYGLERETVLQGYLDTAIDRVVKGISHVLGKPTVSDDDSIMVNGIVELSCGMFDRLRSREWLNCWDISAILEMADRPISMKLGLSIPLHKKDANGKITSIPNPLRRWRKAIDNYRLEDIDDPEGSLVYFCPLNVNTNHFTLLEINERTKMIYHYDSMASQKIIHRKAKSSPARRDIEEEFKYLSFGYTEAPNPQQKDAWSCGLMVVRNATRRMIGLSVGSWNDEVDTNRLIKEVVGNCQTYLENDLLQPRTLTNKRNRTVKAQGNALESSRSSKRLKQIGKGS